jgi:hypothetical protein
VDPGLSGEARVATDLKRVSGCTVVGSDMLFFGAVFRWLDDVDKIAVVIVKEEDEHVWVATAARRYEELSHGVSVYLSCCALAVGEEEC